MIDRIKNIFLAIWLWLIIFFTNHRKIFVGCCIGIFVLILIVWRLFFPPWLMQKPKTEIAGERFEISVTHSPATDQNEISVTPEFYEVQGGDRIEFEHRPEEAFFVDGEYNSQSYSVTNPYVYIQFQIDNGEMFWLPDKLSGYRVEKGGTMKFSVGCKEQNVRIFSGEGVGIKRFSDFKRDKIVLYVRRIDVFKAPVLAKAVEKKSDEKKTIKVAKTALGYPKELTPEEKEMAEGVKNLGEKLNSFWKFMTNKDGKVY